MATKWRDGLERAFWTGVAAALGSLPLGVVLDALMTDDMDNAKRAVFSAATTGIVTTVNALSVLMRHRIAALPNPGEGLPGLPTDQAPPEPPDPPL